ncbi:hypothetical protein DITRI_Ditri19aG0040500 [Diplodiscus trichospermus]
MEQGRDSEEGTRDWRKLFAVSPDQSMQFFPLKSENGKLIVALLDEIFEDGEELWKNTVVVQFVRQVPNFSSFQRIAKIMWGKESDVKVRPASTNLFLIQFSNENVRDRVIEEEQWHIQNKPLIVRRWEPGMMSLDLDLTKVPVWIYLRQVPLELFTNVEIDVKTEVLEFIEVRIRDGTTVSVFVEIPWFPLKCSYCNIFGHATKTCSKKMPTVEAKIWVPKKNMEAESSSGKEELEGGKECDKVDGQSTPGQPWVLEGDFNVTLESSESSNAGQFQNMTANMKEFGEFVNKVSVFYHCFTDNFFTLSNKHQVDFLSRKLDRVMVNGNCDFNSTVEFLAPAVSDHCPAFIRIGPGTKSPSKPFKFFNFWTNHEEFLRIVEES